MRNAIVMLTCAVLTTACGSGGHETSQGAGGSSADGGAGSGAHGPSSTGAGAGGASTGGGPNGGGGAGGGAGGSGPVCDPTPGDAKIEADCDLLQLAVMKHDGGPTDLLLTGRIFTTQSPMASCAVIDGVDVLTGESVVQHLAGGESFAMDGGEHEIARTSPAASDIVNRCDSNKASDRFEVYGIVVHGHADGGTFTAECAQASQEGRWPPALRVTCHDNVDEPPTGGDAVEQASSFMGMSLVTAMMSAYAPHAAGGALHTVDDTVFVIPLREPFDPGQPIAPRNTTGWMGDASEQPFPGGPASLLQLNAGSDALGSDLCPPPPGMSDPSPPAFLGRITGTGDHGKYSTEIFITSCITEQIN